MTLIVTRPTPPPDGSNTPAVLSYVVGALKQLLEYVRSLVTLDEDTRAVRTVSAERAVLFTSAVVAAGGVLQMQVLVPDVIVKDFTSAQVWLDAASGSARWRIDGGPALPVAAAASGMPIAAGGFILPITGALNIRSFQLAHEAGAALNVSITLFQ